MKNVFYALLVLSASLCSCKKQELLDHNKAAQTTEYTGSLVDKTIELSASVDPTWEYDDDESRAIKVTADDAPHFKLTLEELQKDPDIERDNMRDVLNMTSLRAGFYAFAKDGSGAYAKSAYFSTVNEGKASDENIIDREIKVNQVGGKYLINLRVKYKDVLNLRHQPGAVWFANLVLGGLPGIPIPGSRWEDPTAQIAGNQYFHRIRLGHVKILQKDLMVDTHPNSRIEELRPGNGDMGHRHFPLVSDIRPVDAFRNQDGVDGLYNEPGSASNTAVVGTPNPVVLRPRGTIFTFTLENQTNRKIEVTQIEVPNDARDMYGKPLWGTRGGAFSYEGLFYAWDLKPFKDKVIDPANCIPRFKPDENNWGRKGLYPERIDAHTPKYYKRFPVYRLGGQPGLPMKRDEVSAGRFMVWAYVHEPHKPFTVRVGYVAGGSSGEKVYLTSLMQVVNPPNTGFQEGKAYRAKLLIKKDPKARPQSLPQ